MLLRPFTISGTTNILIYLYAAAFLAFWLAADYPAKRSLTLRLAGIMLLLTWLTLQQNLLVLSTNPLIDATRYLRNIVVIVLFWVCIQWVYLLVAEVTDVLSAEKRAIDRVILFLLVVEILYTTLRLTIAPDLTTVATRPAWFQLPMLFTQFWAIALVVRASLLAESETQRLRWQKLLAPRTDLGLMLRQISFAVLLTVSIALIFIIGLPADMPIWLGNISDQIVMFAAFVILFAYMRYQLSHVSLGIRVMSIGLALFLSLSSMLGWLISNQFLNMMLPDVSHEIVVGTITNMDHVIAAEYLPVMQQLNRLLIAIFWFAISGSILFVVVFRLYYLTYFEKTIAAILTGIDQLGRGELRQRLPVFYPDEFGRIATAFNQMSDSLLSADNALRQHQAQLEQTVESRTTALQHEIEQRKENELYNALRQQREQIARDAHDGILQTLFSVRMRLRSRRIRQGRPAMLAETLEELSQDVLDCSNELRQLINENTTDYTRIDLPTTLTTLIDRFNKSFPIDATLCVAALDVALPPLQEKTVIRIVQETLSNAAQHSDAETVCVTVTELPNALCVSICDDGKGFALDMPMPRNAHGLRNIHNRAEAVSGTLNLHPNQPSGTCVELRIPR